VEKGSGLLLAQLTNLLTLKTMNTKTYLLDSAQAKEGKLRGRCRR